MRKKVKAEIVRVVREDRDREVPVIHVVEVEPVSSGNTGDNTGDKDWRRWVALFLTATLFWAIVFLAAWLHHLMTR